MHQGPFPELVKTYDQLMTTIVSKYSECIYIIIKILSKMEYSTKIVQSLNESSDVIVAISEIEKTDKKLFNYKKPFGVDNQLELCI